MQVTSYLSNISVKLGVKQRVSKFVTTDSTELLHVFPPAEIQTEPGVNDS